MLDSILSHPLVGYLVAFLVLGGAIWLAIKGLRSMFAVTDRVAAIVAAALGIFGGVCLQGAGFVTVPVASGPWTWALSGLSGLLMAFAAAGATDLNLLHAVKPPPADGGGGAS